MPFLLPALVALSSDVVILFLGHSLHRPEPSDHPSSDNTNYDDIERSSESHSGIYSVSYLLWLAGIRVVLLLLPLLFHSKKGTALLCPFVYQLLYWMTLLGVLMHILALSMADPKSIETILPIDSALVHETSAHHNNADLIHEMRRIWYILILSLLSDACHLIILMHVRSTAPYHSLLLRRKKNPSVYFTVRSQGLPANAGRAGSIWTGAKLSWQRSASGTLSYHPAESSTVPSRSSSPSNSSSHSTSSVEPALMHAMSEFMEEMQDRLQRTKADWVARLEDFTLRLGSTTSSQSSHHQSHHISYERSPIRSLPNPLVSLTPFRVLLQLFADEDVIRNGKLDSVFDLDEGTSMTFFVPQLLSFLLHGAFDKSQSLEDWILSKCTINVHFAHRCYWFLRSWCLEAPVDSMIHTRSHSDTQLSSPASFLREESGITSENIPCGPHFKVGIQAPSIRCNRVSPREEISKKVGIPQPVINGNTAVHFHTSNHHKLLPEERVLIERLMLRVKECGETTALTLAFGGHSSPIPKSEEVVPEVPLSTTRRNVVEQCDLNSKGDSIDNFSCCMSSSPSNLMSAVESGYIPVDPVSGYPSVKHLDCVSAKYTYGFLPLDKPATITVAGAADFVTRSKHSPERNCHHDPNPQEEVQPREPNEPNYQSLAANFPPGVGTSASEFDKTVRFLDALVYLANNLFMVPPKLRKEELRRQLRAMECEFLPSNTVYVPIGNVYHRVWRIVADESVCIGTKERVPCIVCLEVVEYSPTNCNGIKKKLRPPHAWSFLDRLPGRNQLSCNHEPWERDVAPSPNRRTTMMDGIELSEVRSEAETVHEWRFSRRDPLRRSSLLDKVTSSVRVNMKGPLLEKVKTQMMNSYPEKFMEDEMQSLTLPECLAKSSTPLSSDDHQVISSRQVIDKETSTTSDRLILDPDLVELSNESKESFTFSRVNSAASIVSMGQWTSDRNACYRNGSGFNRDSETPSLPYGSDQDEEHAIQNQRSFQSVSSAAKSPANAPPQVVFRESWQSKQDRLKSKSVYGNHPGWKLLPVLIKANDDLRQEQLASQLIYRMAAILSREKVPVWLCPYEIIALTDNGGIIEAIPDTISLDSLKRNDSNFQGLNYYFVSHFGDGTVEFADAQANFVESLAAYSIVCFLLQLKDRHNGNILLDNRGHIIHIDFGFFFLSSPGKNAGFESAPFKLTRDFVEFLGGPNSRLFRTFRELCVKTFITLRRHCMEIILLVEMLKTGNEELNCFRGKPDEAIRQLRERFRLDLNDRACREYVNCLVDDSIENWRTDWYDRYQRYFVGVL